MLWQRVLTAIVLVPLVVAGTLYLDSPVFAVVLVLLLLIGANELARLANLRGASRQLAYVALVAATLLGSWHLVPLERIAGLQWAMALWWVLVTLSLIFRRRGLERVDGIRPLTLLVGLLVIVTAWLSIVALHASGDAGPYLVLLLFVVIWLADSGAYFAGRAFGKRKLSPYVSPGKTWAGVVGAVVATLLGAVLLAIGGWSATAGLAALMLLAVIVTFVSIGGDLWESRLKREAGIKDSGNLLPGHGGMLDRIDSLLAAAPVFGLGAKLSGLAA